MSHSQSFYHKDQGAALARLKQYRFNGIVNLQMSGSFVSKQVPSASLVVLCGSTIRLNIGTIN
nr:hypothetical protein [uncultured Desulfobacter sp.]